MAHANRTVSEEGGEDEQEDTVHTGFRAHTFAKMRFDFVRAFKEDFAKTRADRVFKSDFIDYTPQELHKKAQDMWMESGARSRALSSLSEKELKLRRFL